MSRAKQTLSTQNDLSDHARSASVARLRLTLCFETDDEEGSTSIYYPAIAESGKRQSSLFTSHVDKVNLRIVRVLGVAS